MESVGTAISEILAYLAGTKYENDIDAETLNKIISIAFYASLQREELQSLKFDFIYLDPLNPDPEPPLRMRVSRWKAIKLNEPVLFTGDSIAKLALATDRRTSALAVFKNEDNDLIVWGFIDQGTNTHLFDTHESPGGWAYPGIVHISVRDLGHLVITHQSHKIIEIKRESVEFPPLDVLDEGLASEALDKVTSNLVGRAEKYISEFEFHDDDDIYNFRSILGNEFHYVISRILLRIQGYGHGGAFIITPNVEDTAIKIKYKIEYDRLAEALVRYEVLKLKNEQYHEYISDLAEDGKKIIELDLYYESIVNDAELEDSAEELTGSIWFASLLSRIDGLIVFDENFSIRGFGAEILAKMSTDEVYMANTTIPEYTLKTATKIDPSKYGTRHRSMIRYINENPEAIGFVISQDGDEKVMINYKGKVVYWKGIKLTVH